MTREGHGTRRAAALLAAAAVLSACSGKDPAAAPTRSASGTPTASPTASPATEPAESPEPHGMETPATTAGTLSRTSFPRPRALGAAWEYAVDPGDAEEGYLGNGTPALERDPAEIVQLAVPFGCARRSPMPAPTHALEVDYAADGVKVIAIRGEFADAVRDGVLLNDRTPDSDPWAELALLDGDQVVLVAAQTRLGSPPMTRAGARRLATLFRR